MSKDETPRRKPRVIHAIWWIPHYRSSIFRQMSQNKDIDFHVVAGDDTEVWKGAKIASAEEAGKMDGIKWKKVKSVHVKGPILNGYEWQPETVKMVWKEDIDAVIGLGFKSLSNWLIAIICRLRGIPYLDWSIGVMGPERRLKWWCRKLYLKLANAHLLYGHFARDWYASHGFKPEQLFLIHNSLNHAEQVRIRESLTEDDIKATRTRFGVTGPDDRLFFHSGRLEAKKNLPLLFEALKELKARKLNIKMVLIGDGRDEKMLKDMAHQLDIDDRVIFYGVCYDELELGKIISASDLCVVPGVTGLIAMHSFVYGTPILTRYNTAWQHGPEVDTVVEGKTGRFFHDGNLDDLVTKIQEMLYPVSCKSTMAEACKRIIDTEYNPRYQERTIIQALNYCLPPDKQIPMPEQD